MGNVILPSDRLWKPNCMLQYSRREGVSDGDNAETSARLGAGPNHN